jgi:hypothetical protein
MDACVLLVAIVGVVSELAMTDWTVPAEFVT